MSFQTMTCTEALFTNVADHTALASSASEGTLLAGNNLQPTFFPDFFEGNRARGRAFSVRASGVFSNTGTPTLIFQLRLHSTVGTSQLGGVSIGQTAAITTTSGITNAYWELYAEFVCRTPGQSTSNLTISGSGRVMSPAGFASPFIYMLAPASGTPQTWTSTHDGSVAQYLNLSATWSASSGSNTITCKHIAVLGLN